MHAVVAPLLLILAIAAACWGYLNATRWEPSRQITSKITLSGSPRYVITDPGVLTLVDKQVDVSVQSDDTEQEVCIALGSASDVAGWTAGHEYTRITGLQDWSTLQAEQEPASGSASSDEDSKDAVAFKDSDLWVNVACDKGDVTLTVQQVSNGQITIVDLGDDTGRATVSMDWVRDEVPDYATPLYFVSGLLAVAALLAATVFAMPPEARRKHTSSRSHVKKEPQEVSLSEALSGSISVFTSNARPSVSGRRRHGLGQKVQLPEKPMESSTESPAIVDPTARNLLTERPTWIAHGEQVGDVGEESIEASQPSALSTQEASVESEASEDTVSISPQELQEYLARLSAETMAPVSPQQTTTDAADSKDVSDSASPDDSNSPKPVSVDSNGQVQEEPES